MEILALILILVQVITKLNRNLLLFWQDPLDNGRGLFAVSYFLPYLFTLFMICPSESLKLLGSSLWGYYSWCDKRPVGSGRGLSTIGDFPYNFSRGAVPASKLLLKPQLASRSWPLTSILHSVSLMLLFGPQFRFECFKS